MLYFHVVQYGDSVAICIFLPPCPKEFQCENEREYDMSDGLHIPAEVLIRQIERDAD